MKYLMASLLLISIISGSVIHPTSRTRYIPCTFLGDSNARLTDAIKNGDVNEAMDALACGAEVDARDSESHDTALILAVGRSDKIITQLMLAEGADLSAKNKNTTPLFKAVSIQNLEMVDLLLDHVIDRKEIEAALRLAKKSGNAQLVEMLAHALR